MLYIPLQDRTKINVTSERGFLVRKEEGSRCYKIYCNETQRIVSAREVTFIEEPDDKLLVQNYKEETQRREIQP